MAVFIIVNVNDFIVSSEVNLTMVIKNKFQKKIGKILLCVMALFLVGSLLGASINALSYQVSYKEVHFVTMKTITTYTRIENPEPFVNITLNADGSKHVSITCYEMLYFSDGGYVKRENQVAIAGMKISAEVYRWSFMNLDSFEDMAKGEEKFNRELEWMAFKSGITQSLPHLQKYRLSIS